MNPMGTWLSVNDKMFATTTGFSVVRLTQWANVHVVQLIAGEGAGTIYYMRYWLLSLAIIGVCIFLAVKALKTI
jgi:hypothetical protein